MALLQTWLISQCITADQALWVNVHAKLFAKFVSAKFVSAIVSRSSYSFAYARAVNISWYFCLIFAACDWF